MNDFISAEQYGRVQEAEGWEGIKELYSQKLSRAEPIRGLPAFRFRPRTAVVAAFQVDLLWLILLPVLLFACAYVAFARRDGEEGG